VLQEIGVSTEDAEELFRAGTLYDDARAAQQESHQGATA
jgi:hypothetical protein